MAPIDPADRAVNNVAVQSEPSAEAGGGRTFVEEARRRQIVGNAIDALAEQGFAASSLATIARRTRVSKGLISYHFAGKDDLVQAVLAELIARSSRFVAERVRPAPVGAGRLAAYVGASFEFMVRRPTEVAAMIELWGGMAPGDAKRRFSAAAYAPCRAAVERILCQGMEAGEIDCAAPSAAATSIQGAIDGVMFQWAYDPEAVDLEACRREVLRMAGSYLTGRDQGGGAADGG